MDSHHPQLSMRQALRPYIKQVESQLTKFMTYIEIQDIKYNSYGVDQHRYFIGIEKGKIKQKFETFTKNISQAIITDNHLVDITDFQEAQRRLLDKVKTADYVPSQYFHKQAVVKHKSQLITFHLLVVARLDQDHDSIKYNQRMLLVSYAIIKTSKRYFDLSNSIPSDLYYLNTEADTQQQIVEALLTNYIEYYENQVKRSQKKMQVSLIQDQVKIIRSLIHFPRQNNDLQIEVQLLAKKIQGQIMDVLGFANRSLSLLIVKALMNKLQQDSIRQSFESLFQIIGYKGSLIRFDILTVIEMSQKQHGSLIVGYALIISRKTQMNYRRFPHNQWMTSAAFDGFKKLQSQVNADVKIYMQTKEPLEPVKLLSDSIKRTVFCISINEGDKQVKLQVIVDVLNKEMMKVTGIHIDHISQEAVSYLVEANFKNDLKVLRGTVGNKGSLYRFDLLFRADTQTIQSNQQQNTEEKSFKIVSLYFVLIISKKTILGLQGKFPGNAGMREELRQIAKRIQTKISQQVNNFIDVNLDKDVIKKGQYFTHLYKEERKQKLDAFVAQLQKEMLKMTVMSKKQLPRIAADFLSKAIFKEDKLPQSIKKFETETIQNNVRITFHVWVLQQYLVDEIHMRQLKAVLSLKMLLVSYALLVTYQPDKPSKIQKILNDFRQKEQQQKQMIVSMMQPSTKSQNFSLSFNKLITEQQLEPLFNNLKSLMITWTQISSDQLLFQTAQFITNFQATSSSQETSQHFQTIVRYKDKLIRFDLLIVALQQSNEQQEERFSEGVMLIGYALYAGWKNISELSSNQQKLSHAMKDILDYDGKKKQWDELREVQEKMNEALDTEKMFGKNELCPKRQVANEDI